MIEISKLIFQKEEKMLDDSSIGEQIMESIFGWTEEATLGKYQFTQFNELGDKKK